ncbi:hypothetical protein WN944_015147 [Citrus x changshan-huyou]|uniref:Uncharacterized protein n=1 Tax=Citrus x changshan-huyou TaxID=2935761 RepID=A0AAP0QJC8_9ROSI
MERFQQANMVTRQELNAIHALASQNFLSPAIIEGGDIAYSHPDKKILHLGRINDVALTDDVSLTDEVS